MRLSSFFVKDPLPRWFRQRTFYSCLVLFLAGGVNGLVKKIFTGNPIGNVSLKIGLSGFNVPLSQSIDGFHMFQYVSMPMKSIFRPMGMIIRRNTHKSQSLRGTGHLKFIGIHLEDSSLGDPQVTMGFNTKVL